MGDVQAIDLAFGIPKKSRMLMNQAFASFTEIDEVLIFGSRAMGNYKSGSDIDIALKGEKVTWEIVTDLAAILNERLPIPYHFDVVDYQSINDGELLKHINQYGRLIYSNLKKPI